MSTRAPRSRSKPNTPLKGGCRICKQLRYFIVLAICLLVLMWVQPDWRLPQGIDYNLLVGDLFLWAFIALLVYKFWQYRRSLKQSDSSQNDAHWRPPTPEEFKAHRERIERRDRAPSDRSP